MKKYKIFITVVILLVFLANVNAQDWPQYLGPYGNSTSDQQGILRSWPEEGPEVLWTVDVGIGYGGPVVKDGKAYLLDRDDKVGDNMRCFDLNSGKELWNFEYNSPGEVMFPGSRSVPVLDGNHVYSCGLNGDLYCFDINTHKPVWNKNVWSDFGGQEIPRWAISQCPIIYGDLLIIASQAPDAGVVAYDKLTGNVKWKTPALGPVGYVSPAIVKVGDEDHVVMMTASAGGRGTPETGGLTVGIDPLIGKILWEYTNWKCRIPAPGAFDAGDGKILIIGAYRSGSAMIEVSKKADGSYNVTELFKTEDFGGHTKPPLFVDGYFYAHYRTNERRDGLVCMNMDGKIMWKTGREPEFNKGSMIVADGLILATDGGKSLYLIKPDPSGFKPIASAELLTTEIPEDERAARYGTQNWGPMALADGKLLIRDQSRLMCVKVAE
ncbi:MAG: PQQ-like beta-propeller repeat protein [Mariniphaga sp.]|nr:PQQ-like beta-propeller repeat protein [Mariniphaga sp.]